MYSIQKEPWHGEGCGNSFWIILYSKQKELESLVKEQVIEKESNNALMINILSTIVEFRNGESGLHVIRIRIITEILMEALRKR